MTGRLNCRWDTANGCTNGWRKSLRVPNKTQTTNESWDAVDYRMSKPFGGDEEQGQEHHGDAYGVLMEAASGGVNSSGGGEGAEADGHTDTADGNDGGAGALENRERDAGPS